MNQKLKYKVKLFQMSEKKTWKSKYRGKSQYIIIQVCSRFKNLACWFEQTSYPAPPCTVHRPPDSLMLPDCFDSFGSRIVIRPLFQLYLLRQYFLLYLPSLSITKAGYVTPGLATLLWLPER